MATVVGRSPVSATRMSPLGLQRAFAEVQAEARVAHALGLAALAAILLDDGLDLARGDRRAVVGDRDLDVRGEPHHGPTPCPSRPR